MSDGWQTWLPERWPLLAAGASGGIVRWLSLKESWRDGARNIVIGVLCAAYLGPIGTSLISPALSIVEADAARRGNVGGFLIGIGGSMIVSFIINVWRLRAAMGKREKEPEKPE